MREEDRTSCDADRAVKVSLERELHQRITDLDRIVARHMSAWASRRGMPQAKRIARTAVTSGAQFALREALRTVLGALTPLLGPEQREAPEQRRLNNLVLSRLRRGVSVVDTDKM